MENNSILLILLAGGGGPIVTGIIGWYIKGMLSDIKKIRTLEKTISELKTKVDNFSGEMKSLNNMIMHNNKDIAVNDQKIEAAFRHIDSINRSTKL